MLVLLKWVIIFLLNRVFIWLVVGLIGRNSICIVWVLVFKYFLFLIVLFSCIICFLVLFNNIVFFFWIIFLGILSIFVFMF